MEAAEGHSSTAPSKWDGQPFTIWCQIAVFITAQLYCFVFFFFLKLHFSFKQLLTLHKLADFPHPLAEGS